MFFQRASGRPGALLALAPSAVVAALINLQSGVLPSSIIAIITGNRAEPVVTSAMRARISRHPEIRHTIGAADGECHARSPRQRRIDAWSGVTSRSSVESGKRRDALGSLTPSKWRLVRPFSAGRRADGILDNLWCRSPPEGGCTRKRLEPSPIPPAPFEQSRGGRHRRHLRDRLHGKFPEARSGRSSGSTISHPGGLVDIRQPDADNGSVGNSCVNAAVTVTMGRSRRAGGGAGGVRPHHHCRAGFPPLRRRSQEGGSASRPPVAWRYRYVLQCLNTRRENFPWPACRYCGGRRVGWMKAAEVAGRAIMIYPIIKKLTKDCQPVPESIDGTLRRF